MTKFRISNRMGKIPTNNMVRYSTVRYKLNLRAIFTAGSHVKSSVVDGSRSEALG